MSERSARRSRWRSRALATIVGLGAVLAVAGPWLTESGYRALIAVNLHLSRALGTDQFQPNSPRMYGIRSQLEQFGPEFLAIVGDSITEAALLRPVCGKQVLNAGIGAVRVGEADRGILPLFQDSKPLALVLALGVNDARRGGRRTAAQRLAAFAADYRTLVRHAKALAPSVAVALIGPVETGKPMGDLSFDTALIAGFNDVISAIAAQEGVLVISLAGLSDGTGGARPGSTSDGVHLTARGYAIWHAAMATGWMALLKSCAG